MPYDLDTMTVPELRDTYQRLIGHVYDYKQMLDKTYRQWEAGEADRDVVFARIHAALQTARQVAVSYHRVDGQPVLHRDPLPDIVALQTALVALQEDGPLPDELMRLQEAVHYGHHP